ncbi:MAG TPA: DUF4124 domain-containing protein, partial [Burkholderiales bacterium]|nr:DUF4124 domain-containing protein [Burkholderiales bacterium]
MSPIGKRCRSLLGLSVAFLLVSSPGRAETIYKWIDQAGVVTYSQEPPRGGEGRDVQQLDIETLSPEQRRAARVLLKGADQRADAAYTEMKAKLDKADEEVRRATEALKQSEASLRAGREPLPGERKGTVGGFTRLTQAYFDRLHRLEE